MSIFSWLNVFSSRLLSDRREQGFNYAAGELLRGKHVVEVESQAYDTFHENEFKYGMQAAILAWDRRNYETQFAPTVNKTCPVCKGSGPYVGTALDDHPCDPHPQPDADWETPMNGFPCVPRR